MTNELEQIKTLDTIINETITEKFDIHIVNDNQSLTIAEENVKFITGRKKIYKNKVEPFKKILNGLHRKVTSIEKSNVEIFDESINAQKKNIADYKHELFLIQQEKMRKAKEEAEREEARLKKIEEERIEKEKAELLKSKPIENFEQLKETTEEVKKIDKQTEALENIYVEPEKVVLKKDEVKKKYKYSIYDEVGFISWALKNNLELLRVEPNMQEFNKWVKLNNNSEHPFIKKEEVF
jgi:hypothetical protein